MVSKLSKFDIFALPFSFYQGQDKKQNKTIVGGIVTLVVFVLSFSYLIYLCYLYSINQFQPTHTSRQKYEKDTYKMEISQDLFSINIVFSDGSTLASYEQQTGKKLGIFLGSYAFYDEKQGKRVQEFFQMVLCDNPEIKDSYCFDFKGYTKKQNYFLLQFLGGNQSEKLQVGLVHCSQESLLPGEQCETDQQIIQTKFFDLYSYVKVQYRLKQYNTQTKELETKIKIEQYYLDVSLTQLIKYTLQKTMVTVDDGFIIKNSNDVEYFSDFTTKSQQISQDLLKQQFHLRIYALISIELDQFSSIDFIQYIQFPQLLAQFSSVLNTLLLIGVFAKFFSEAELIQDFIELHLKVYYKKTALELIQGRTANQIQSITNNNKMILYNLIKNTSFKNKFGQFFKIGFYKRLLKDKLKIKSQNNEAKEQIFLNQLIKESQKSRDIYSLQKDILQLKMIIKLILKPDQYAAIQLCGSKLPDPKQFKESELQKQSLILTSNQQNQQQDKNQLCVQTEQYLKTITNQTPKTLIPDTAIRIDTLKLDENQKEQELSTNPQIGIKYLEKTPIENHLEEMDEIDRNENLLQLQIQKFLKRKESFSILDKRIHQSMIGIDS